MRQQVIKYGLTTALRSIEVPTVWDGTVTTERRGFVTNTLRALSEHGLIAASIDAPNEALRVPKDATGICTLERDVAGNAAQHTTVMVAPNTTVKIHETINGAGTFAGTTTFILGANATVEYAILIAIQGNAFVATETTIANAQLTVTQAILGDSNAQLVAHATIGDRAKLEIRQVVIGTGHGQVDAHASSVHVGPHSQSDILTRGILDDSARALFHGLIRINPEAHDVDSYQKTEAILLSETAGADAIPNLEIHDHRVKCSHGASIGRLDAEKLFYLMSRGIDEVRAKQLVTEGFIVPLLPDAWLTRVREALGYTEDKE